jgi:intraflagellar transport protein 140
MLFRLKEPIAVTSILTSDVINSRLIQVSRQIELVACFAECQRSYSSNPTKALQACKALLQEANINAAVRKGDIYGFMIEHYVRTQNFREAYGLIQELKAQIPNVNLSYYINTDALLTVEKSLGVALQADAQSRNQVSEEEDD